jgi:mono/diheme cytochrome c family protein
MTRSATYSTLGTAALAVALTWPLVAGAQQPPAPASGVMAVERQNELVKTRCMICHTDANRKGGLSLQSFDAARPDPSIARMMAVKVGDDGAMMAAGAPVPDRETTDAFVGALSAATRRSAPAPNGWTVDLTVDPLTPGSGHSFVTARAIQALPLPSDARASAVYRLTLSCNGAVRRATVQLSTYTKAGPDAPTLARTAPGAPTLAPLLSADTFGVNDLFPGEHVVFPIGTLSLPLRELFSWCFAGPDARNGAR